MAVIIGNSTQVSFSLGNTGIISVDWSQSVQTEKFYTFGATGASCGPSAYLTLVDPTLTVSISLYGGSSSSISTCAPTGQCRDSPAICTASVTPSTCKGSVTGFSTTKLFITSYSYSKERGGYGTESWQGLVYPSNNLKLTGRSTYKPAPKYRMLTLADGSLEGDASVYVLETLTGTDMDSSNVVSAARGSVRASQLSIGDAGTIYTGSFTKVGGSKLGFSVTDYSVQAKANVSLTLVPYYGQ